MINDILCNDNNDNTNINVNIYIYYNWGNIVEQFFCVASWLLARFAIVPFFQIILNLCIVWQVRYCGQKSWGNYLFVHKNVGVKKSEHFFWKNIAFLPVPKESDRLLNPY